MMHDDHVAYYDDTYLFSYASDVAYHTLLAQTHTKTST